MAAQILQLNCQKAYSVVCDFGVVMCESGSEFALIQEPYATDGCVRGLPAFMRVFTDIGANSAVVVNNLGVDCSVVSRSERGVCVFVVGQFGKMFLASVYCRFGTPIEPYLAYMSELVLLAGNMPLVIGMDANASSLVWFSKMSGRTHTHLSRTRGESLSEWILNENLVVLNQASELYTFDSLSGSSDIDVSVVNSAAANIFTFSWSVCSEGVSDHNLIKIVFNFINERSVRSEIKRWCIREINWGLYGEFVKDSALSVPIDEFREMTVDSQIVKINEWGSEANDRFFSRYRRPNVSRVKWWNTELTRKRREVRRLRKRFQRAKICGGNELRESKTQYRVSMKEYKKMIVSVKEKEWREFVRVNADDPWGQVYKICKGKGKNVEISGLQSNGNLITTWSECVEVLLNEFFPADEVAVHPHNNGATAPPPLEESEIVECMNLLKARKSPGMDGLTGQMCKNIYKAIPEYLGALFAKCMNEGYFPREWKSARVIVLLKSPDKVRSNPRSYRGISLLPVLAKVLERIMIHRLQQSMNEDSSEFQFGFKKGNSVEDAWLYVKNSVSCSSKKLVLGMFIDFKGAFDYLCWASVLSRLREVGCQEYELWKSYFSDRQACVVGVNDTVCKNVSRGCPQGSICGPFIWNLMMDPLLRQIGSVCKVCAYADDLLVIVEGDSRLEIERLGECVMNIISEWSVNVGVDVSTEKSSVMLLKGKLSLSHPPRISLNGLVIKYVKEVKYLGVCMKERMNFLIHLDRVREKMVGVIGKLRRILRSEWGLSRRAVRVIYEGMYVACAAYASSVWGEIVLSARGYRKILACQRVALLGCLPVCRTVSIEALQVLAGAPPLDLEVMRRCITFGLKRGLTLPLNVWGVDEDVINMGDKERKLVIKEWVFTKWDERWRNSENGRVTYEFVKDVRFVIDNPNFDFGLSLGFLLTGHGSLNAFLHKRGLSVSSGCSCGENDETWFHVLCECSLYADIREIESMGIVLTSDGSFDFSGVLLNTDSLGNIKLFACEVFNRRRSRLSVET